MSNNENTTQDKALLPEVQAYFDALAKAKEEYKKAEAEVGERHKVSVLVSRYSGEYENARTAALREVREARQTLDVAPEKARLALLENATDPLVKWIAENTLCDYTSQSEDVMKQLPASMVELEEWAEGQDFCGTWDMLCREARDAGALEHLPKDARPVVNGEAWDELSDYLAREFYAETGRKIKKLVKQVVAQNQPDLRLVKDSPSLTDANGDTLLVDTGE